MPNKLTKLDINIMTLDEISHAYKNDINITLNNLVILTTKRLAIANILYKKSKIITGPYTVKVDENTYKQEREEFAEYFIETILQYKQLGKSNQTINTLYKNILVCFNLINKIDTELKNDITTARQVFFEITHLLMQNIRLNIYSPNYAKTIQHVLYKMLKTVTLDKENEVAAGIPFFKYQPRQKERTNQSEARYHYRFYMNYFTKVYDFLINHKTYPLDLDMNIKQRICFPNRFVTGSSKSKIIDFNTGKLKSFSQIKKECPNLDNYDIRGRIKKQKLYIEEANQKYSEARKYLANSAMKAFYILFETNTGMNETQASLLEWHNDYEIEDNEKKFCTIKNRAKGKEVNFIIKKRFVKIFKQYLELRNYILQGSEMPYLFFGYINGKTKLYKYQTTFSFSSSINNYFIKNFDSNLPRLSSTKLRVNKTNILIKKHGIIAASLSAQNNISTLIQSYTGTMQEDSDNELNLYFEQLNKSIFSENSTQIETHIGSCVNYNKPKQKFIHKQLKDNCERKEGCLFCEHYRLHADKEDITKIYSLQFIIHECRYIAQDEKQFQDIFQPVLLRIHNIEEDLIQSGKISKDILIEYKDAVFEKEILHPYWDFQFNKLLKMGILK